MRAITGKIVISPKRLVEARQSRGYTRKELSNLTMIPLQTIREIEKGSLRPTKAMLISFSEHLGLPIEFFKKSYRDAQEKSKKKVNLFVCGSFGCRITEI